MKLFFLYFCFLEAHTCSFVLDLPAYTTAEIMYERLSYAITYCCSTDGDEIMNGQPTADLFDMMDHFDNQI